MRYTVRNANLVLPLLTAIEINYQLIYVLTICVIECPPRSIRSDIVL